MKAVVISGGNKVDKNKVMTVMEDCDLLFCADRGTDFALSYGLKPDYVIGDMDSIDPEILKSINQSRVFVSPSEKDYTDTHLAVKKAIEKGCDSIDILCATGLRSDHALANIRLLLYIDKCGSRGRLVDDENTIYLCTGNTVFRKMVGRTISLLSLDCNTEGITLKGFKYPLKEFDADLNWVFGISNKIESENASISISRGCLLVFEIEN